MYILLEKVSAIFFCRTHKSICYFKKFNQLFIVEVELGNLFLRKKFALQLHIVTLAVSHRSRSYPVLQKKKKDKESNKPIRFHLLSFSFVVFFFPTDDFMILCPRWDFGEKPQRMEFARCDFVGCECGPDGSESEAWQSSDLGSCAGRELLCCQTKP